MRITTKYTYVYRIVGIIGCLLVLASLFMPWLTINAGSLQGFSEESSPPTGWQLANLDKGGAWDENIFAYFFMIVYAFLIMPPVGIIMMAIGKDARGIGYYMLIMSIFFLILLLVLMPTIQQSIPTPEDPYKAFTPDEIANMTVEQKAKLDEQKKHRDEVLNMKRIQFIPTIGIILTVAGAVVTYVGARLISRDSDRLNDLYNYYVLLVEAHKGGRITKEEEDLLAAQRKLYKVIRSEHEMLLHRMYPNDQEFQNAVYMHDHPVDMDRMIIEKNLQDYEVFLAQALGHGEPTKEELVMLEVIRRTLNISMDDHYMVVEYLKAEGRIKEAPPAPKPLKRITDVPKECLPSDEVTPRYVHSWEYKSTITRETPLDAETPAAAGSPPPPLTRTSLVPPAPKMDRPTKPTKIGEIMGGEDIPAKAPPPAAPSKPAAPPPTKPAPGPIVVQRPTLGVPPAPKKEAPEVPEPIDEEEEPPAPPVPKPAPTPPAEKPQEPAKLKPKRPTKVKCNKCGTTIPVPPSDVPVAIKCPNCGVTGKV